MNYLRNQKGNALLLVLLVTVIVSTIGLAVVSSTIGGAKRTAVRVADVDVTYEAVKAIDSYSAALSARLRSDPNLAIGSLTSGEQPDPAFDMRLDSLHGSIASELKASNPAVEAIQVEDITSQYSIDTSASLTRVFAVSIQAIEPDGAAVSRTATKELIVSPLPSFLKYALGSEKGTLFLNGSPHFQGDLFANKLSIDEKAYYETTSNTAFDIPTPLPSVSGDLYVGTPGQYENWDFDPASLTAVLRPENFYDGQVPALKNDSQYQSVYFQEAYEENRERAEQETEAAADIRSVPVNPAKNLTATSPGNSGIARLRNAARRGPYISGESVVGDVVLEPERAEYIEDLAVQGSLTIIPQNDIILRNISVSGGALTILNRADRQGNFHKVRLEGVIMSDRGVVIENQLGTIEAAEALLYDEQLIEMENDDGTVALGSVYSQGDVFVINGGGTVSLTESVQARSTESSPSQNVSLTNGTGNMTVSAPVWAKQDLIIQNAGTLAIDFPDKPENTLFSGGNINFLSTGRTEVKNHLEAKGSITLNLAQSASVESLVLAGDQINLYAREAAPDAIYFDGSLFAGKSLAIQGDEEEKGEEENDLLSVSGAMYAYGKSTISNLAIRGWNDGQLVSLSGGPLLITRINEFQNFQDSDEPAGGPYVPKMEDAGFVQPLKGFFYTDKDVETDGPAAELYGVGSLFFIDGGLFAKGDFVVNAVRGETNGNQIKSAVPASGKQKNHFSRFIVNYDRSILLGQLDYLPQVEFLSVYSDQLTVE